jgi:hypothetical protein
MEVPIREPVGIIAGFVGKSDSPLGNLGRVLFSPTARARLGWRFGRFRSLASHPVVRDDRRPTV